MIPISKARARIMWLPTRFSKKFCNLGFIEVLQNA
jgi:hypothetical protein